MVFAWREWKREIDGDGEDGLVWNLVGDGSDCRGRIGGRIVEGIERE